MLINPNRVLPPVPPIGLEYLSALVKEGHVSRRLDLTFIENTDAAIDAVISAFMPDIAGVTIQYLNSKAMKRV